MRASLRFSGSEVLERKVNACGFSVKTGAGSTLETRLIGAATLDKPANGQRRRILRRLLAIALAACFFVATQEGQALAQKTGGTLRVYNRDSPASMSILEESALSTVLPMMGVFNNL